MKNKHFPMLSMIFVASGCFVFVVALLFAKGSLAVEENKPIIDESKYNIELSEEEINKLTNWSPEVKPVESMVFYDESQNEIGNVSWKSGKIVFTGEVDESAKVFFEYFFKNYLMPCKTGWHDL